MREIEFRGIVVSEGWALDKRHTLPLLVAILLGVVVAARFLFGWDTAWTVGAFFVALISLLLCISEIEVTIDVVVALSMTCGKSHTKLHLAKSSFSPQSFPNFAS